MLRSQGPGLDEVTHRDGLLDIGGKTEGDAICGEIWKMFLVEWNQQEVVVFMEYFHLSY
jgi:hypothetical protein